MVMADYKLFVQRIGLIGVTNLFLSLSGIILLPILTKNLPIQDYGIWAQITVTIAIVTPVASLGLDSAIARYLPSLTQKEEIQEIFYSIFFLVLPVYIIVSALIYIFSGTISSSLFYGYVPIVKILSVIIFFECINNLFLDYLRAKQMITKYSLLSIIKNYVQVFSVSFLILMGKGLLGAIFGLLLTNVLVFLIMAYIIYLNIGVKIPKFKNMKEYLSFGIPLVPMVVSGWVVNSSDRYVIGLVLGAASVGYYSPGYSLGSLILMFLAPISILLPVTLSKYYDENNLEEVNKTLYYSLKYFLTIGIPAVFGLSFLSKSILNILSTPKIAEEGYLIVPFVALSFLIYGVQTIYWQILILKGQTKVGGKTWLIASLFNILLNFLLIPYTGIIGAAITTLFAFTFAFVVTAYYSTKIYKLDPNFEFILKSIFASIMMSLVIVVSNPTEWVSVMITIGICTVVYFIVLLLLKGFDKKEFISLKEFFNLNTFSFRDKPIK
jgi:O-antigen/teichoic acid export membrane protein